MELHTYLQKQGRGAATALAKLIEASPSDVVQWAKKAKDVPAVRAVRIEKATDGAVTRRDLRPNDWRDYWPELASQPATALPQTA